MEHCKYLDQQFLNESTADMVFVILKDGKKIPAHKVVLAASSLKFEKQFNEIVDLKKIEINDVSSAAFQEFLYAFYAKHPEKNYTMENIFAVLHLARAFDVDYCTSTCEQFLVQNLTSNQLCIGYSIAMEFKLAELKVHCQQKIDMKKAEALTSQSFFACGSRVFYDLLNNITIRNSNEIKLVWDACLYWVQIRSGKPDVDVGKHIGKLVKHFGDIAADNEDFQSYAKQHYTHLFTNNNAPQINTHSCQADGENRHQLMVVRLNDTMLTMQHVEPNDEVKIELTCTKEIILSGVAFSTVSGYPRGKLSVSVCGKDNDGESLLAVQNFDLTPQSHEPRNFVAIGAGILLEPNQIYIIRVNLHQDIVYYKSYTIKNHFNENDLIMSFAGYKPDIFSHFLFNV